jgi:hypothetical protein
VVAEKGPARRGYVKRHAKMEHSSPWLFAIASVRRHEGMLSGFLASGQFLLAYLCFSILFVLTSPLLARRTYARLRPRFVQAKAYTMAVTIWSDCSVIGAATVIIATSGLVDHVYRFIFYVGAAILVFGMLACAVALSLRKEMLSQR